MKALEAIILLAAIWGFIVIMFVFVVYWFKRNNILMKISEFEDNLIITKTTRCRIFKGSLYSFNDFFHRRPIINLDKIENDFIKTESAPIIGVTKTVFLKNIDGELVSYGIYNAENTNVLVNYNMIAWVNEARSDLYKATELTMSKGEQIAKIIIPIGMIILAVALLIFFPKIYNAIMEQSTSAADTAINRFTDTMNKFIPKG